MAEAAAPQLVGPRQAEWLDQLDAELGNLRAAIAVSLTQPDPEPGPAAGRLAARVTGGPAAMPPKVPMRCERCWTRRAAQAATLPRARALAAVANVLQQMGSYVIAEDYGQEALAIAAAAGDDHLVGELLYLRAWILLRQGQRGAALPLIEQGLGLARHLGEPHLTGFLLSTRAHATYAAGDHVGAARNAAEALSLFRQAGDRQHVATMLGNLGNYELSAGDLDAARRHLAEALDIFRALNHRDGIAYQTLNLGLAEYLGGSPGAAEALFAESLDLTRRMGIKALTAYALIGLALAGQRGVDPGWSARLHGAADQALADLGRILEPLEARLADLDRQRLRAAMGAEAFEAEYAAGRSLDLAQVLAALGGPRTQRPGGRAWLTNVRPSRR